MDDETEDAAVNETDGVAPELSAGDDKRVSRREALRKAATGATVMGAVWAGPRVEGLSLVPDYASAGTVHNITKVFVISNASSDGPASVNSDNGGAGSGCDPYGGSIYGNDWAAVAPASNPGITVNSPQPNARNAPINMTYTVPATNTLNPGPAGTINALIPSGWDADLNNNEVVTMQFAMNETNNRCRVQSAVMALCNPGTPNVSISGNPAPGALNSPASFNVDVNVAPGPSNMKTLTITVECT